MVKHLESNKMYTNMIVWMKMPEAQKSMAEMVLIQIKESDELFITGFFTHRHRLY